jgi:puromycin-sensitive aminopeptidase
MSGEAAHRLPRSVTPEHYDLTLEPDLSASLFAGCVGIDVTVHEPTDVVVLNAAELTIAGAELMHARSGRRLTATPEVDVENERVALRLEETATPGSWRLHADFGGVLNDQLRGFYRSTFVDADGGEHVIATTQFEATDARRAFPCWDEPDLKATFSVTLVVPDDLMAVSCGPVLAEDSLGDGRMRVAFGTTMPMSTYLLAFVVGPFEAAGPVDVDGTPLRVIHVPGRGEMATFPLEFGAFALRWLREFYGIPYPAEKLDLLAVPDFASGAMENVGAVIFRETGLLVDPAVATQAELVRVADVVAHEIAHMWFGNLVTMRWWNGLWLKEAFATFMEAMTVDAYRPDWRRWATFAAERNLSMDTDGLRSTRPIEFPVGAPSDADAMFDVITYQKGAAVLKMLQQFLGEDVFRRGITRYLRTHQHGNADTHDLWVALEAESGKPVQEIMESWIFQGGHPRIDVEATGNGVRLSQERFLFTGSTNDRWNVPVVYGTSDGERRVVVNEPVDITGEVALVNVGGSGYYRTRYVGTAGDHIAGRLTELTPSDRFVVVADTWAGVLSGDVPASRFLELVSGLRDERDVEVWGVVLDALTELDRIISSDGRPELQSFVRRLLAGVAGEMGWVPEPGEADERRRLRGVVLRSLGVLGADPATIARASTLLDDALDPHAGLDGDVTVAVLAVVASHGTAEVRQRIVDTYLADDDPQTRSRLLAALVAIPEVTGAEDTLAMVLDGRIRSQDAMRVVATLIGHRIVGAHMWVRVKEHWDELMALMPPAWRRLVAAQVHHRTEPDVAQDIRRWFEAHPIQGGDQYVAQRLERMGVRESLRVRERHIVVPGD